MNLKQQRLDTVKTAKVALEAWELANHPDQTIENIEDKAQISFADKEAGIMGKNRQYESKTIYKQRKTIVEPVFVT